MNIRPALAGWETPPNGWIKLNIDGASRGNPDTASRGGIFRNPEGMWMGGFTCGLGVCTAKEAEFWSFYHGLQVARSLNLTRIIVEHNSIAIVKEFQVALEGIEAKHWQMRQAVCLTRDW